MSWSSRRRTIYIGIIGLLLLLALVFLYYFFFYKEPTCFDGKQNQDEQGIDCGGVCVKVCGFQAIDPIVLWSRYFKVVDGVYNVVALIENPNSEVEALDVPYSFKIYDEDNILINERRGVVDISSNNITPIFERNVTTGERFPVRNPIFDFTSEPVWTKITKEETYLSIKDKKLVEKEETSRLEALLENQGTKTVQNIEITAVLFNSEGNAIAVSQTMIDSIEKKSSEEIIFTWPELLLSKTSRIEIISVIK